ncbi:RNA polymerase sigma factor [Sedimentibacter sp. MB31-C6]|uniref:RNA polymerase sigma factor n=1 Tax=Sedimentibacter sp. MB31-C6 TaxID=3109366 RepID=UPI002DDD57A3|nr:sigma-70 family RNA polymerase sigma factor [Sedimentibacter sp. MB36-C1]WSI03942.1 sigma-70 family RNA polymerase sigma factor [Sedimentibacter sp. MB36-C1]
MIFMLLGDEEKGSKLERLYDKYRDMMFYVAYNVLHDGFLAEDAVHQSFVQVYNHLHKIDENNCRKTRNLFVTICKNVSINMYNQRKKQTTDEINENITSDDISITEIVISNESYERLNKIIEELKPIYQEAIFLKYSHGFSVAEIAEMKNIKPDTVQKRIERAKKQLLILLNKEGELNG